MKTAILRFSIITILFLVSTLFSQRPVRIVAEWEPAFGTLIRWPLGIPYDLVVELAKDDSLYITVSEQSLEDAAIDRFTQLGVNMDHCVFIRTPTNTHWTRDWGPNCTFDENGIGGIHDPIFKGYPQMDGCEIEENGYDEELIAEFAYIRSSLPRYDDDDKASSFLAQQLGWPHRQHPTYLTGGNIMNDGVNTAISSYLMIDENSALGSEAQFKAHAKTNLGITNYHIVNNPEISGIQHIDCFATFVNEETIIVKDVAQNNPEKECVERLVDELKDLKSCYNRPYTIIRIYCGEYSGSRTAAYTNSLILNKKVLVPLYGISSDDGALETFRQAFPGYEVIGFLNPGKWYSYDALHCRTMAIFDRFMLRIAHRPIDREIETQNAINIIATIDDRSEKGLIADECNLFWRKKDDTSWQKVMFNKISGVDSFQADIPPQNSNTVIEYYLSAADSSGRTESLPRTAPDWFYTFKVNEGTPINTLLSHPEMVNLAVLLPNKSKIQLRIPNDMTFTASITDMKGKIIQKLIGNSKSGQLNFQNKNRMQNGPYANGAYLFNLRYNNIKLSKLFILLNYNEL